MEDGNDVRGVEFPGFCGVLEVGGCRGVAIVRGVEGFAAGGGEEGVFGEEGFDVVVQDGEDEGLKGGRVGL